MFCLQEPINDTNLLFSVQMNEAGRKHLRRLHTLARYMFMTALLITLFTLYFIIRDVSDVQKLLHSSLDKKETVLQIFSYLYVFVFIIVFPQQVFYFYRF